LSTPTPPGPAAAFDAEAHVAVATWECDVIGAVAVIV
jgi:hypothetical protein